MNIAAILPLLSTDAVPGTAPGQGAEFPELFAALLARPVATPVGVPLEAACAAPMIVPPSSDALPVETAARLDSDSDDAERGRAE